jgi:hypothetical protein
MLIIMILIIDNVKRVCKYTLMNAVSSWYYYYLDLVDIVYILHCASTNCCLLLLY